MYLRPKHVRGRVQYLFDRSQTPTRRTLTADARPSLKGRLESVAVRTPPALAHASPHSSAQHLQLPRMHRILDKVLWQHGGLQDCMTHASERGARPSIGCSTGLSLALVFSTSVTLRRPASSSSVEASMSPSFSPQFPSLSIYSLRSLAVL